MSTSAEPKRRHRIPITTWGARETRKLYDRFHVMRWKALKEGTPFAWENFAQFLEDVAPYLPEGYLPSLYRMRFETGKLDADGQKLGYCRETLVLTVNKGTGAKAMIREIKETKEKRQRLREGMEELLVRTSQESAEMTQRMLNEEVDLAFE